VKLQTSIDTTEKTIYPIIENVAFLYWISGEEELANIYFKSIRMELEKQAKHYNISLTRYTKNEGVESVSPKTTAFIAVGRFRRSEFEALNRITPYGVFIDTSPDESRYDCVRPNLRSMVYQIVDYFVAHGHRRIGFLGGCDYDPDSGRPLTDIREEAFRARMQSCGLLRDDYVFIADAFSVQGRLPHGNAGNRLARRRHAHRLLCCQRSVCHRRFAGF
jgi:LacI family transcriptional regulator